MSAFANQFTGSDPWHISVLIPARDEEDLLQRCLESVLVAREAVAGMATCDVIVAVDRSTDATFSIARKTLGNLGSVIRCDAGAVGAARAEAARIALGSGANTSLRLWLANTDADCIVPPSWLSDQLLLADAGVHAVAGIVSVDSFAEHDEQVSARFRTSYILHTDGTHPHVHGANLGVRAEEYMQAGGWAHLRTAEDHDLWRRLAAVGARRISSTHLRVTTSGRRVGRAPMGFAAALAAHNEVALEVAL